MAVINISAELLAEMVFGFADHPVEIVGAGFDSMNGVVQLRIRGSDVPESETVVAQVTEQRNRAGERLRRMTFKAI